MARGIQFAEQPRNANTTYSRPMRFDMICKGETLSGLVRAAREIDENLVKHGFSILDDSLRRDAFLQFDSTGTNVGTLNTARCAGG